MTTANLPIKILIVDDDEEDFFITSSLIKDINNHQFDIEGCSDYDEAVELITRQKHDIYFVDFRLGAKTGLELIEETTGKHGESPIVLLTGYGNREIDVKVMEAGSADYLIKPGLTTEKIERCIRYSLERSRTLKALRANEQKYRNIFERSRDVIFLADEQLFFRDINDAVVELLGYDREELLARSLYTILADQKDKETIHEELIRLGEIDDKEIELFTRNGDKKYCILSLSSEIDISGGFYIQGIIHDITNLKKAEKVTLQVEKLAVTGRLVKTLAHEVRNPLNNINLAAVQMEKDIPEDVASYLQIIQRNSQRIADIISELLQSSGPPDVIEYKKSLQEIVCESIDAARDRLTLKKIRLRTLFPDELVYIMADAGKLKIAFLNIIINAIEAMTETEGELEIEIKKQLKNVVIISDNGSGISEENLSRLFEPYFTSKRNGLGLGLAATLNILQSHKATVDVHSQLNKGTVFTLSFLPA